MTLALPLSILEFKYQRLDPFALSKDNIPLWHSVFGNALHQNSCIFSNTPCFDKHHNHPHIHNTQKNCALLYLCNYPYLFDRIAPPDSEMMRGKKIPVPHVFRFNTAMTHLPHNESILTVTMVVIGQAISKYDAIIQAMQRAGSNGIGKQRYQIKLIEVKQHITEDNSQTRWQNHIISPPKPDKMITPQCPSTITIRFETPYKTKSKFDAGSLLMGIIRRISLLQYFYTDKRLQADFKQLKQQTQQIEIIKQALHWQRGQRFSARSSTTADTSGWMGQLEIKNNINLWPYLWLGQWLGIGKNASMGFGRYRLE
jgi:hypothetical protein